MPAPPIPELPPALRERFEPLREIGRGGMGVVLAAHDRKLGRTVAIKVVDVAVEAEDLGRMRREARSLAALSHPHVVRVHDGGLSEGQPFIVLEYIEGSSLHVLLRAGTPARPEALEILIALADALAHVHEGGIVHRDVKPANVLMRGRTDPVLIDFGLVKSLLSARTVELTRTGQAAGTPLYMSPEVMSGEPPGPASDVFALGLIAFELLTGRNVHGMPPGGAPPLDRLVNAVLTGSYWTAAERALPDTERLKPLLLRCLKPDGGGRPTAADLRDALEPEVRRARGAREEEEGHATLVLDPALPTPRPARVGGRRPARGAGLAVGLAVALSAVGWLMWPVRHGGLPPVPPAPAPVRTASGPGVLELSVWTLDTVLHLRAVTASPARLSMRVSRVGGAGAFEVAASGDPAHVHRATARALEPGATYQVSASFEGLPAALQPAPLLARTAPPGFHRRVLGSLEEVLLSKPDLLPRLRALQEAGDDLDVPDILAALPPVPKGSQSSMLLRYMQRAVHPANAPWVEALLAHAEAEGGDHAGLLLEICRVLAADAGPVSRRVLARLASDPAALTREEPRSAERCRLAAMRALALVAPDQADTLCLEMSRDPARRDLAAYGRACLGRPVADAPAAAACPACRIAAAATGGGAGAPGELARWLEHPTLPPDLAFDALDGLALRGDGAALPAVDSALQTGVVRAAHPSDPLSAALVYALPPLHALGALGARTGDPAFGARLLASLGALEATGEPDLLAAALGELAALPRPPAAAALEAAVARLADPPVEAALALARAGSASAAPLCRKFAAGGDAIGLWIAAVAAASLPAAERAEVLAIVERKAGEINRTPLRESLGRALKEVDRLVNREHARLVFPSSPWLPAGLALRAGDRFRILACGFAARRPLRTGSVVARAGVPSSVVDVTDFSGLEGRGEDGPRALLIGRLGRQRLTAPIASGALVVAQDDGELLVRADVGDIIDPWGIATEGYPVYRSAMRYVGLYLVAAVRE